MRRTWQIPSTYRVGDVANERRCISRLPQTPQRGFVIIVHFPCRFRNSLVRVQGRCKTACEPVIASEARAIPLDIAHHVRDRFAHAALALYRDPDRSSSFIQDGADLAGQTRLLNGFGEKALFVEYALPTAASRCIRHEEHLESGRNARPAGPDPTRGPASRVRNHQVETASSPASIAARSRGSAVVTL